VEKFLTDNQYVAADRLTLADFSVWSILEPSLNVIPVPKENYPKIFAYIERMRNELPFKDFMANSIAEQKKILSSIIEKNKAAKAQ
jgi:glutathione S-transferase